MYELHGRRRLVDLLSAGPGALEKVLDDFRVEDYAARWKGLGERGRGRAECAGGVEGGRAEDGGAQKAHRESVKAGDDGAATWCR